MVIGKVINILILMKMLINYLFGKIFNRLVFKNFQMIFVKLIKVQVFILEGQIIFKMTRFLIIKALFISFKK